jgi:hypothetical protein
MKRLLSIRICIGPIIALFIGGVLSLISGYPVWTYILWGVAVIWLIGMLINNLFYKNQTQRTTRNWIMLHERQNKELPLIPDYLLPVVIGERKGQRISKDIQLRPMSSQFWNRLLPSQRDELKQLVEWLDMNWDDYYELMRRATPRNLKLGKK